MYNSLLTNLINRSNHHTITAICNTDYWWNYGELMKKTKIIEMSSDA